MPKNANKNSNVKMTHMRIGTHWTTGICTEFLLT